MSFLPPSHPPGPAEGHTYNVWLPLGVGGSQSPIIGQGALTSSSLKAIMETARKTASVEPVMVVMRSGQEPSEMVMRALLWGRQCVPSGAQSSALLQLCVTPSLLSLPHPTQSREPPKGTRTGGRGGDSRGPTTAPRALTCSRILFTVSPFCGKRNRAGSQGQEPPGVAQPKSPGSYLADDAADLLWEQRAALLADDPSITNHVSPGVRTAQT